MRKFVTLIALTMTLTMVLVMSAIDSDESPMGGKPTAAPPAVPVPGPQPPAIGGKPTAAPPSVAIPRPQPPAIGEVPPSQWAAMKAAGVVRPGCPVTRRAQLRRVDLDYRAFNGDLRRGHLVVRDDIAESVARIFTKLLKADFPIRRMVGVEKYGGDVKASLRADNTSAFNCRRPDQINAPTSKSPHANGRAIDINPRENPWRDLRCDCWVPGGRYAKRVKGPGKILHRDTVWQAFIDEGWIWQNIKVPDYMHFDTGYPSRTFKPAVDPA